MRMADQPEILVIGDSIWDRYLTVEPRANPESPVPAWNLVEERDEPGGALNAAEAVKRLGGRVRTCCGRGVSVKTRVRARHHGRLVDITRIDDDVSSEASVPAACESSAVLIADYGKGACSRSTVRAALDLGLPLVVDPHVSTPLETFEGVGVIKMNRVEAEHYLHRKLPPYPVEALAGAAELKETASALAVVITLEQWGAVWAGPDGPGVVDGHPVRVVDTIGAGDAFAAALVYQLALGCDYSWSIRYANSAAAASVQGEGCTPPKARDVELVRKECPVPQGRLILTNGCFDCLHVGHLETLRFAAGLKKPGDVLVAAVNSDRSVAELKGEGRPLLPATRRLSDVLSIVGVDGAFAFDGNLASQIQLLRPEVLVKGGATDAVVGAEQVERYGGEVVRGPRTLDISTTDIAGLLASKHEV